MGQDQDMNTLKRKHAWIEDETGRIKDETLRNQGRGMKGSRTNHEGVSRTRDEEIKKKTRRDQGQTMKKSRTRHEENNDRNEGITKNMKGSKKRLKGIKDEPRRNQELDKKKRIKE